MKAFQIFQAVPPTVGPQLQEGRMVGDGDGPRESSSGSLLRVSSLDSALCILDQCCLDAPPVAQIGPRVADLFWKAQAINHGDIHAVLVL